MRKASLAVLLCLAAWPMGTPAAEWVSLGGDPGTSPLIEVLESNNAQTIVEIAIPGMWVEEKVVAGNRYQILAVPEGGVLTHIGKPQMPVMARFVGIPPDKDITVCILERDCVTLIGYNVYPAQPPPMDIVESEEPPFAFDQEFYAQNRYYPAELATVGEPMIWRDYRVVLLTCKPFRFNSATGALKVCRRMKIKIEYSSQNPINVPRRRAAPTRVFGSMYRRFIINYEFLAGKTGVLPGGYLIITHDNFYDAAMQLASWKHSKGIPTTLTRLSEIPPGDSAAIHTYIRDAYDSWAVPPEFVLLVGDTPLLPVCHFYYNYNSPGFSNWVPNDHTYSLVAGTDYLSDVLIGRIPANTVTECATMVGKLVGYEEDPYLDETAWYEKAAGVAAEQPGRVFRRTCERIRGILLSHGYSQVDQIYEKTMSPEAARAALISSLNDGRSFLTFRGHGAEREWVFYGGGDYPPVLYPGDVSGLQNGRKQPIVIAPTCLANDYSYSSPCIGELFINQSNGAGGYFGATNVSFSFYNDSLAIGIYKAALVDGTCAFQAACNVGKLFMRIYFPEPDELTELTFYLMNMLGDPALEMWTDVPQNITAYHPDGIYVGPQPFTVDTDVRDALVCLYKGEEVYERGHTDNNGDLTLIINPETEGNLHVTVTKHNCSPHVGVVKVLTPLDPLRTDDLYALAGSTQRKITAGSAGNLHLVYVSGGAVFYAKSTDRGTNWEMELVTGSGHQPCIALDPQDNVHVAFGRGGQVYYSRKVGSSWQTTLVYEFQGLTMLSPALAVDQDNYAHLAFLEHSAPWYNIIRYTSFLVTEPPGPVEGITIQAQWPSLTLDQSGVPYVSYNNVPPNDDGWAYYVYREGSGWSDPTRLRVFPNSPRTMAACLETGSPPDYPVHKAWLECLPDINVRLVHDWELDFYANAPCRPSLGGPSGLVWVDRWYGFDVLFCKRLDWSWGKIFETGVSKNHSNPHAVYVATPTPTLYAVYLDVRPYPYEIRCEDEDMSVHPPPPGIPLTPTPVVCGSGGTRHNNALRLMRQPSGRIELGYTTGDYFYFTFREANEDTWAIPKFIGDGKYPALALDWGGNLNACWTREGPQDSTCDLYFTRRMEGIWAEPVVLYAGQVEKICSASCIVLPSDTAYVVWEQSPGDNFWQLKGGSFHVGDPQATFIDEVIDTATRAQPPASPSIAQDSQGKLHLVWDKDIDIYYGVREEGGWKDLENISESEAWSVSPCIDVHNDTVHVVWQEDMSGSGVYDVYYRSKKAVGAGWGDIENISWSLEANSIDPIVIPGSQVLWSEDIDGNYQICRSCFDSLTMGWSPPTVVLSTEADSRYPQAAFNPIPPCSLYVAWTEGDSSPYHLGFHKLPSDPSKGMAGTETAKGELPLPRVFGLSQSCPNPSRGDIMVRYQLPQDVHVSLRLFNLAGQVVRTLVHEAQRPGYYSVRWDGKDVLGKPLASGVYLCRLQAGDFTATKKMVVLR